MRTVRFGIFLAVAACARPVPPRPQPEPSATPVAPNAAVQQGNAISDSQAGKPRSISVEAGHADSAAVDAARVDSSTVAIRATELFGQAEVADATAVASAAEPSWDIEVHEYESTDRVERYLRLFSGPAKDHIQARLERGTQYEAMIRARMREGGIPEDMYYLALIESGFDPNAYSRAAAVGMWQFMTSTARDVGLRVDWWVDERRDPFKSTTAAVRFIKGLRDQFGSLYLAAAAYNGGPGRIARGLNRYADDLEGTTGDDLFFALAEKDYLRNETREYVPQLIAAALIAKEPARYGMKIDPQPALTYDSVRVGAVTSLGAVAKAANVPSETIRALNPHLLRGVTPPNDSFFVRVPTGLADSTAAALAEMPAAAKAGVVAVESKKGESLESIARKVGIPARQIAQFNPKLKRLKSGNLAVGQRVLVPTATVASEAAAIPDPEIERYGSSTASTTMHVVKSGETLGSIARKYGTTTSALLRANGLKRPLIFPGQSLVVKGKGKRSTAAASSGKASASKNAGKHAAAKTSAPKTRSSAKAKASEAKSGDKPKSASSGAHAARSKTGTAKAHGSASKPKKKAAS